MMRTIIGLAVVGGATAVAISIFVRRRRRLGSAQGIPIIQDAAEWAALHRHEVAGGAFAFYSSAAGAVTTRPELFTVAIDDHAIVRGHAVFDTCSLARGRLYRLRVHLDRLFASAAKAKLPLPYGADEDMNRRCMTDAIRAACLASGQRDANVRYWWTAGTGNLGITPAGCKAQFYVLVFGGLPMDPSWTLHGVREASVPASVVPHKPRVLAELKSNNYMWVPSRIDLFPHVHVHVFCACILCMRHAVCAVHGSILP